MILIQISSGTLPNSKHLLLAVRPLYTKGKYANILNTLMTHSLMIYINGYI